MLSGSIYLVGGKLSCADVQLLECTLMLEEKFPAILSEFPNVKVNVTSCVRLDVKKNKNKYCVNITSMYKNTRPILKAVSQEDFLFPSRRSRAG